VQNVGLAKILAVCSDFSWSRVESFLARSMSLLRMAVFSSTDLPPRSWIKAGSSSFSSWETIFFKIIFNPGFCVAFWILFAVGIMPLSRRSLLFSSCNDTSKRIFAAKNIFSSMGFCFKMPTKIEIPLFLEITSKFLPTKDAKYKSCNSFVVNFLLAMCLKSVDLIYLWFGPQIGILGGVVMFAMFFFVLLIARPTKLDYLQMRGASTTNDVPKSAILAQIVSEAFKDINKIFGLFRSRWARGGSRWCMHWRPVVISSAILTRSSHEKIFSQEWINTCKVPNGTNSDIIQIGFKQIREPSSSKISPLGLKSTVVFSASDISGVDLMFQNLSSHCAQASFFKYVCCNNIPIQTFKS